MQLSRRSGVTCEIDISPFTTCTVTYGTNSEWFSRSVSCRAFCSNPNEKSRGREWLWAEPRTFVWELGWMKGKMCHTNWFESVHFLEASLQTEKVPQLCWAASMNCLQSQDPNAPPKLLGSPQISTKLVTKLQFFTRQKEESVQCRKVNYIYWI